MRPGTEGFTTIAGRILVKKKRTLCSLGQRGFERRDFDGISSVKAGVSDEVNKNETNHTP
jgi:hypothetical protein